jgi:hypothetical protein
MGTFTSPPIKLSVHPEEAQFVRADIVFNGLDHSGSSFEGRVFVNNIEAGESTPTDAEHGYVGSFYIFGHGGCFGGEGHCDVPSARRPFDRRGPHQLTPATKKVIATEAIRKAFSGAEETELRVSVVPVVREPIPGEDPDTILHFREVAIFTYA